MEEAKAHTGIAEPVKKKNAQSYVAVERRVMIHIVLWVVIPLV
jgi:hypothetical protein